MQVDQNCAKDGLYNDFSAFQWVLWALPRSLLHNQHLSSPSSQKGHLLMTSTETLLGIAICWRGSLVHHFSGAALMQLLVAIWEPRLRHLNPRFRTSLWRAVSAPEIVLRSAEALIASALTFTSASAQFCLPCTTSVLVLQDTFQ